MMVNKRQICGVFIILAVWMLGSCGKKDSTVVDNSGAVSAVKPNKITLPFPQYIKRDGAKQGGTLVYGLVADTPWTGIFNSFLYSGVYDGDLLLPVQGSFVKSGANHEIIDGGYCNLVFDPEAKTAVYKINPGLTWSDGVPVTADDIIFVYECVGSPDYAGVRYDSKFQNIIGMEEYHTGKAKNISGLERIDNKTLKVAFKTFPVGTLWGQGLIFNVEPAHYLKDIPLKTMESHDRVRKTPLSCGPFVVKSMVQGDSVEYVPNPYWFGKKPLLDRLIFKRIAPTSLAETIKAGDVDVVAFTTSLYDQFVEFDENGTVVKNSNGFPKMKVNNINFVSGVARSYVYIGIKQGTWNKTKNECQLFPDGGKFKDKALRQAIAYAMDMDSVCAVYYHGLRIPANSLITPAHPGFYNADAVGYRYNPEKAKQLLDDAGYKDVDDDGYRETPDGKPLKINFLSMSGSDIAEPVAQYYIQNWKDVGLNVSLNEGRLFEFNAFYDKVQEDDPSVELYQGAWGVGSNPFPGSLYGQNAQFNFTRWANPENERLLQQINSPECFDESFRKKAYREWDAHIMDEAVCLPLLYGVKLFALNKRVNWWDERTGDQTTWDWCDLGILQDKPAVNTMK